MIQPAEILDFWFDPETRPWWFAREAAFDARLHQLWFEAHQAAAAGALDSWRESPGGALALILLLDRGPRHFFRGTGRAFATDEVARAVTHHMLDQAWDLQFRADRRLFTYLPLEHAESLAEQRLSVFLIRSRIGKANLVEVAERHLRIIERFGRFPQRNAILGRESTSEELAFLAQSDDSGI
jgi:uncharacterized protein (DUF924 family)